MEIFYDDLKKETQQAIKNYYGVKTDKELFVITNWDTIPMAYATLDNDNIDIL
jgi:hypothetical protein